MRVGIQGPRLHVQIQITFFHSPHQYILYKILNTKKSEPFYGDMYSSLSKTDKDFHWSKDFGQYAKLSVEDKVTNHLRMTRIEKVGCMLIFLVSLSWFYGIAYQSFSEGNSHRRSWFSSYALDSLVFQRMLQFPNPNRESKLLEFDSFITNNGDSKNILAQFFEVLSQIRSNSYQFDIDLLKEAYRELVWLFVWLVFKDTNTYFQRYVLFLLHLSLKMGMDCDWVQVIPNEITHHSVTYQQSKRFFMLSYLVYAIVYNYVFQELPPKKDVDFVEELLQFWYPMPQKHKSHFHIYQIHDSFLGHCKAILVGATLDRITKNSKDFWRKRDYFMLKNHTLIYGFLVLKSHCSSYQNL